MSRIGPQPHRPSLSFTLSGVPPLGTARVWRAPARPGAPGRSRSGAAAPMRAGAARSWPRASPREKHGRSNAEKGPASVLKRGRQSPGGEESTEYSTNGRCSLSVPARLLVPSNAMSAPQGRVQRGHDHQGDGGEDRDVCTRTPLRSSCMKHGQSAIGTRSCGRDGLQHEPNRSSYGDAR